MTRCSWLAVLLLAGCAGGAATAPGRTGEPPLSAELLPFEPSTAVFADSTDPVPRSFRVEPSEDGATARLVLELAGTPPRELLATRTASGISVSGGLGAGTELIRFGALTGDTWESAGQRVVFDGWERLHLANANYDAARISARSGPPEVAYVETWWFAPRVGLVRLRSDRGTLVVRELVRTSP